MASIVRKSRTFWPQAVRKLPQTVHTLGTSLILIPIGIANSVLIGRSVGPGGKGSFDLIIATATLLLMILGLSIPSGVTYEVARGDANVRKLALQLAVLAVIQALLGGLILAALVQFGQASRFLPAQGQKWWILGIVLYLFFELMSSQWRAILVGRQEITKANHCELFARISQFVLLFAVAGALYFRGLRITVVALFAVVFTISLLLNLMLLAQVRPAFALTGTRNTLREAFSFAFPCYLGNATQFLNYRLDVFIVGAFAGYASVGRYTLAVSLGQLVWLLSTSAATVLLPKIAASQGFGDAIANTNRLNRLVLAASFASALMLGIVASQAIPLLYGEAFRPSFAALVWILPGITAFSTVNVLAAYIAGIGQPRLNLFVAIIALVVTLSLDLYLIPRLDIIGASLASTASYSVSALLTITIYIRKTGSSVREVLIPTADDFGFAMQLAQPILRRVGLQRAV